MYRAGGDRHTLTNSQASSNAYKQPTRLSVPVEGGTSNRDRTFDSNRSARSNGLTYNNRGYGHRNQSGSYTLNRDWSRRGQEGFQTHDKVDFEPGRAFRDDHSLGALEWQRPAAPASSSSSRRPLDDVALRLQQTAADRAAEIRRKKEAQLAQEAQRKQDDGAVFSQHMAEQRARFNANKAKKSTSTVASQATAGPSSSISSSTSTSRPSSSHASPRRKETGKHSNRPPVDIASANAKTRAFLSKLGGDSEKGLDDARNVDSDDELVVVSVPTSRPEKAKAPGDKGKGKERAKDDGDRADDRVKKKSSSLGKLRKKNGFESPPPEKREDRQQDIGIGNSKLEKQEKTKAAIKSLADLFAEEQEGKALDDAIHRANEDAKKEKTLDLDENDVEIIDPLAEDDENDEQAPLDALALDELPQREETPDELLDDDEEELDPSRLCPFCDRVLPEEPSDRLTSLRQYLLDRPHIESRLSARNSQAKYLPIVEIASFCQLHKVERTVIPEGKKRGYPMKIKWSALPQRIESEVAPHLSEVILGETSSRFLDRAKQDWDKNNGFKRTNITAEWDSFQLEEPGYYGPRGFECIHSTLRQLFTVDNPILTPGHIAPFSCDFYLRRILVPETALELIRLDLGLARTTDGLETASRALDSSRAFGKAAHGIVENVDQERVSAREEESRLELQRERERDERARREQDARDEEERREAAEEERRIAQATRQYRQPKALANLKMVPTVSSPGVATPSSSGSSTKKRAHSSDDDDDQETIVIQKGPKPKPKMPANPPTLPLPNQPGIAAFMSKGSQRPPSTSTSTLAKGKVRPLILDSDSDDDDDVDPRERHTHKHESRRASSPEKPRPLAATTGETKAKRRASSPIRGGQSPTKKKKKQQQQQPDREPPSKVTTSYSTRYPETTTTTTGANAAAAAAAELDRALEACSDLESDVETHFQATNRTAALEARDRRKAQATEQRKRTIALQKQDEEFGLNTGAGAGSKGKLKAGGRGGGGGGGDKDKDRDLLGAKSKKKNNGHVKVKRPRLAADSSDSD